MTKLLPTSNTSPIMEASILAMWLVQYPFRFLRSCLAEWCRPQACLGTASYPPEILDMILEHLPSEARIAFALTCRDFYRRYMPSIPLQLQPDAKERLLLLLEKDMPSRYFCHRSCKLHSWSRIRFNVRYAGDHMYGDTCRHDFSMISAQGYNLDYTAARLIINRHLYGPSYGPRLNNVEESRTFRDYKFEGIVLKTTWRPQIIENELFLRGTVTAFHRWGNAMKVRQYADNKRQLKMCRHIAATDVPELGRDHGSGALFTVAVGPVRSCPQCFTDYQVDGWVIHLTKWMQLGSCRSPGDPKWNALVYYPAEGEQRALTCPAGRVRYMWEGPGGGDRDRDVMGWFTGHTQT